MRKESKNRYVSLDFVGVAGAGKTTLAKELISLLEKKEIPFVDLTMGNGKYTKGIWNKFKNSFQGIQSLYLTFLLKPNSVYDFRMLFKYIFGLCIVKRKLNKPNKNDKIRIFDEGIFKRGEGIVRHSGVPNPIVVLNKHLSFIRNPYIIVILEVDYNNIVDRRMNRGLKIDKRFVRKFKSGTAKYKSGVPKEFDKVLAGLDETINESIEIIRLKNNDIEDTSRNAQLIIELLNKRI